MFASPEDKPQRDRGSCYSSSNSWHCVIYSILPTVGFFVVAFVVLFCFSHIYISSKYFSSLSTKSTGILEQYPVCWFPLSVICLFFNFFYSICPTACGFERARRIQGTVEWVYSEACLVFFTGCCQLLLCCSRRRCCWPPVLVFLFSLLFPSVRCS